MTVEQDLLAGDIGYARHTSSSDTQTESTIEQKLTSIDLYQVIPASDTFKLLISTV